MRVTHRSDRTRIRTDFESCRKRLWLNSHDAVIGIVTALEPSTLIPSAFRMSGERVLNPVGYGNLPAHFAMPRMTCDWRDRSEFTSPKTARTRRGSLHGCSVVFRGGNGMTGRVILLTIKCEYAEQILARGKPTEYRTRPPRISRPTRTVMYVSGLRQLIGEFTMEPVSGERTPLGYPLPVRDPIRYATSISWESIRRAIRGIRQPQQSFRYLDPTNAKDSRLLEMLRSHCSGAS